MTATYTAHYTDHTGTYTQVYGDTLAEVAQELVAVKPEYSGDESVTVWSTETEQVAGHIRLGHTGCANWNAR